MRDGTEKFSGRVEKSSVEVLATLSGSEFQMEEAANTDLLTERRKHCACAGCSKVRTMPARQKTQTGPITIHCTAS